MAFQRLCRCAWVAITEYGWATGEREHTHKVLGYKRCMQCTHTHLYYEMHKYPQIQTHSQPGTHSQKEVRWAERYTCAQEKTHTSTDGLTGWEGLTCPVRKGILNSVTEDSLPRRPTLTDIQVSKSIHLKQALLAPETALFQATLPSDLEASQSG